MRILIVEDSETRLAFFRRQCDGHELAVADTAQGAIELLGKTEFDLVFLDHDLAEPIGTGRDVALHLRTSGRLKTPVIIHSMNLGAAEAMVRLLSRARAHPFALLKDMAITRTPAEWVAECLAMARTAVRLSP
ncbi:MAG: response regulator [Verrucomicrobiae bacterium]|nr:response regulator [Verrucomicrobiae bacterium]